MLHGCVGNERGDAVKKGYPAPLLELRKIKCEASERFSPVLDKVSQICLAEDPPTAQLKTFEVSWSSRSEISRKRVGNCIYSGMIPVETRASQASLRRLHAA